MKLSFILSCILFCVLASNVASNGHALTTYLPGCWRNYYHGPSIRSLTWTTGPCDTDEAQPQETSTQQATRTCAVEAVILPTHNQPHTSLHEAKYSFLGPHQSKMESLLCKSQCYVPQNLLPLQSGPMCFRLYPATMTPAGITIRPLTWMLPFKF